MDTFRDGASKLLASVDFQALLLESGKLLLILVVWWIITRVARHLLSLLQKRLVNRDESSAEPANETQKRISTLIMLVRQAVYLLLTLTMVLLTLKQLGIDIGPVLASAGVLGLAVGFGAQNLVRDIISGFFLILENQVRVGDVAIINGTGGLVEKVNFRTLILRDLSGTMHVFPNGEINTMSNLTSAWSAFVFDIGVSYNEDPEHVIEVMKDEGRKMREDPEFKYKILEDFEVFGLDKFADSAMIFKGRVKTKPIEQWGVGRAYHQRLKKRFDEEGITIPFPQRDLYLKQVPDARLFNLSEQANSREGGAFTPRN